MGCRIKLFLLKLLAICLLLFHLSSGARHSLRYFYTSVTGMDFPEFSVTGQVDEQPIVHYDSNMDHVIPMSDWSKTINRDNPDYWKTCTLRWASDHHHYRSRVERSVFSNQTKSIHVMQKIRGCELDDDGTIKGFEIHGFDGEDFMFYDLETDTWVAASPKAFNTKNKWNSFTLNNKGWKYDLEKHCIQRLKHYLSTGRTSLKKKVPPVASLFQRNQSSPVVCHITGFFPRDVQMTWQKDGEDLDEDVELKETLPNHDGTFQKRSILYILPENLKNNNYTCIIHHSSLENDLVLVHTKESVGKGLMGIIIIISVLLALISICCFFTAFNKVKTMLGFKPVPQA